MLQRAPPAQQDLEYLAGFFDGDGCVTAGWSKGSCRLKVSQVSDRGEASVRFHAAFGGGIYALGQGRGAQKPSVQWPVSGQDGRAAAKWPSMKTAQLQIAAAWPQCPQLRMVDFRKLKQYKLHCHAPDGLSCSWAYIAGFFDAEGCITIPAASIAISLTMTQRNRAILDCILAFLEAEQPGVWRPVSNSGPDYRLKCSLSAASREALQKMLSSGLVVKRQEAEFAPTLNQTNHLEVRESLAKLYGNQSRYLRFDAAGALRAKNMLLLLFVADVGVIAVVVVICC
ncbi:unnamed protein product [Polarella glacialis]|uniref:LAGLIDADG endonuclease n=1 Tax=Polarella glacialis TaxID=89957 RepID=A0A813FVR5_POLGL|nr:unnamed protein product [Polarella glacialis]